MGTLRFLNFPKRGRGDKEILNMSRKIVKKVGRFEKKKKIVSYPILPVMKWFVFFSLKANDVKIYLFRMLVL